MSIWEALRTLTVGPLELAFEFIFSIANRLTHNLGISIFVLSMVVNILVLPLYNRADELQEEEREKQKSMDKWVRHIKKTFTGDEKMMMLQTYYRQNDYNPIFVLKSSVSLILQVPFFIAAYNFLSELTLLKGASFGPIANLGAEDAMFMIGNFPINILPILMTVINIVSGAIYTKGSPLKLKLQLYGVALVFLILLYRSPSGLVFYWTLNNVFSLCKNIVTKLIMKNKKGAAAVTAGKNALNKAFAKDTPKATTWLFFATGVFLALLTGGLLPLGTIVSDAVKFSDAALLKNPALYLIPSLLYGIGFFVLWFGVFYLIAGKKIRYYFVDILLILAGIFLIDGLIFGTWGAETDSFLRYIGYEGMRLPFVFINLLVICLAGVGIHFLYRKKEAVYKIVIPPGIIVLAVFTAVFAVKITKQYQSIYYVSEDRNAEAQIPLSGEGKNVCVILLGGADGSMIPFIMENEPDLKVKYDGFTYYPNSEISDDAFAAIPEQFNDKGYGVTVCDPPFTGKENPADLSVYDNTSINAVNLEYRYNPESSAEAEFEDEVRKRNLFCYSFMNCMPAFIRGFIYNQGLYHKEIAYYESAERSFMQTKKNRSEAVGLYPEFMNWYDALEEMPFLTDVRDTGENHFVLLYNGLANRPMILQEPNYEPVSEVDNREYDSDLDAGYIADGKTYRMDTAEEAAHYQTNLCAVRSLSNWVELLKWEGIYDNTKIVIVSHGGEKPLLMIKDYNASGYDVSEKVMTDGAITEWIAGD